MWNSNIFCRARERDCNFKDPRISFDSIIGIMTILHAIYFTQVPVLEFFCQIIEMLHIATPISEIDRKLRDGKLQEIVAKLNMNAEQLNSITFTLATAKVFQAFLAYINDHNTLSVVVVDKFLTFMKFSLKLTKDEENYEVLCNMFYYFLTSSNLKTAQKLQMVNFFFVLDGHNTMIKKIHDAEKLVQALQFKSRVVLAEVMKVFMEFMTKSPDADEDWKKKSYEIVFKGNVFSEKYDRPESEQAMMYIFLRFVDFTWKKPSFDKIDVLANTSTILAVMKTRKETIDPTFYNMLTTLYTSTFINISIKGNKLLKISSNAVLRSIKNVKTVDLNFLKWLNVMGKPKPEFFNQLAIKFLSQAKLDQIEPHQSRVFDKQIILKTFLNPSTKSLTLHTNLKEVLCSCSDIGKSPRDFEKLMKGFKNLRIRKKQKALNVMDVIIASAGRIVDTTLKKKTATNFMTIMTDSTSTQHEKLAVIQAATNLFRCNLNN